MANPATSVTDDAVVLNGIGDLDGELMFGHDPATELQGIVQFQGQLWRCQTGIHNGTHRGMQIESHDLSGIGAEGQRVLRHAEITLDNQVFGQQPGGILQTAVDLARVAGRLDLGHGERIT